MTRSAFLVLVLGTVFLSAHAADAEIHNDVAYATHGGEELKLDLAVPPGKGPFPLVVFIHGGAWKGGNRQGYHGDALKLVNEGFVAATVSYRFTPKFPWPAQRDDVQAAVRFLRANAAKYRIDASRVGAVGHSAGGHLSLMLGTLPRTERGTSDAGVDAVVNFFGPTDMTTDVFNDEVDRIFDDLCGGPRSSKADVYRDVSPVTHISRGDAPVLTFHGPKDELIPLSQAHLLHKALDAAHVPNRFDVIEGYGHGWGGETAERTRAAMTEWFKLHLVGSPLPMVASDDFTEGASRWKPTEPEAWTVEEREGRKVYVLGQAKTQYAPRVRSPFHIALLETPAVGDFVLDVEVRSTVKDYGHRDLCLFFGHQDADHFYYAHIGKQADPHAHSVFLVDAKDRVSIARERTQGYDWDDAWHRVRIVRECDSGRIDVYVDDFTKPVIHAEDKTFLKGRVGLGSFDDRGEFAAFRLRGKS